MSTPLIRFAVSTPPGFGASYGRDYRKALAFGINRTLEDAQAAVQQHLPARLTIRSAASFQYLARLVKFERFDRATPEKLSGQMGIQSTGTGTTRKSADLLIKLATGGTFTRPVGSPFFIPITGPASLRPTPSAVIPRAFYPSSLRLIDSRFAIHDPSKQARRGSRGGVVVRGKRRTFAIDPAFHRAINPITYGIYQRRGRGPESETFFLWLYRTRIRLPQRVEFYEVAMPVIQSQLASNVEGFLNVVLRG